MAKADSLAPMSRCPDRILIAGFVLLSALGVGLGYRFYLTPASVSAFWPASGVLLAALVLTRRGLWPLLVVLDVVIHDVWACAVRGEVVWRWVLDASGQIEALVGASILRAIFGAPFTLSSVQRVLGLAVIGGVVAPALSGLLGAWTIVDTTPDASYWSAWQVWWIADALGVLIVAPVLISWLCVREREARPDQGGPIEAAVLLVGATAVAIFVFGRESPGLSLLDFPFLVFPFLIWAALRFDKRIVSVAALIVSVVAVECTDRAMGPFARGGAIVEDTILSLQTFFVFAILTPLLLHAAVDDRRRARIRERHMEGLLLQAQRMELVGRLASGVAHDYRNLLMLMDAASEDIRQKTAGDDTVGEAIDQLQSALARAEELSTRLQNTGRQTHEETTEDIDLDEAIRNELVLLRHAVGPRVQVTARLESDARVRLVEIEQVLLNLAVNARDAMPDGGTLEISTETTRVHAVVHVRDDGTGMDEATAERIFDPYFTTKPTGIGTGLGLATVVLLVERVGGSIAVESQPGAGTTFTIRLPLA